MTVGSDPKTVVLLGTHGQCNVGDELLLETFLDQLGPAHRYRVNSYHPQETTRQLADRFDVTVFDTASGKPALVRHLLSADLVVFGGGSILKELYPSTGRRRLATLAMVLGVVVFARLVAGTPVMMSNIGVGPVTSRPGRLLTRAILGLTSVVSVRDRGSFETCMGLGARPGKVRLVPDAVWVNGPEVFAPEDRRSLDRPEPARIALNLNRDIENGPGWAPFLDRLEEALRLVADKRDIELHALPMQSRFKAEHDLAVLEAFVDRLPEVATVIHRPVDHREVGAIIDDVDVVVSERLHALVIAATMGRACVALPYDVKVRELVDQLDLGVRSFDVNHVFDPEDLARALLNTIDERETEGRRLATTAEALRAEAHAYFVDVRAWMDGPGRRWDRRDDRPRPNS